jgi:hypothetical protein
MPPCVFKLSRVLNLLKPLAVFLLIVPHKPVRIVAAQLARHAPRPGGWDPSAQSEESKSEQARQCMDVEHCLHWLHLEPTPLLYYTGYTWSPLPSSTTLATLGAHSPPLLHCLHLEPTHQVWQSVPD